MEIRAAVCDDDKKFALLLKNYIQKYFQKGTLLISLDVYSDSQELFHVLHSGKILYQVLFLDIDMPGLNGLDLARQLKNMQDQPYFIFISGVESMVFQAFIVNPFWFVRKRLWKAELSHALSSLRKEFLSKEECYVPLSAGQTIYRLDIHALMYVECTDKTLHFHYRLQGQDTAIHYKMSDLEDLLAPYGFIRVHKGYLVNYRSIFYIDRSGIRLDNGEIVPVSKYRLQEIKQLYGSLL